MKNVIEELLKRKSIPYHLLFPKRWLEFQQLDIQEEVFLLNRSDYRIESNLLFAAIQDGNLETLSSLVDKCKKHLECSFAFLLFHSTCVSKNPSLFKSDGWIYLRNSVSSLLEKRTDYSVLHHVLFFAWRSDLARKEILKTKINLNILSHENETVIQKVLLNTSFHTDNIFKELILHGASIDLCNKNEDRDEWSTESPLHMLAFDLRHELIEFAFKNGHRININIQNNYKQTPLHIASDSLKNRSKPERRKKRRVKTIRLLLSLGADPNIKDEDGLPPLTYGLEMYSHDGKPDLTNEELELFKKYNANFDYKIEALGMTANEWIEYHQSI